MAGYVYEDSTTGAALDVSLQTGEGAGKDITHQKQLRYIHYDIDTHGKDVVMTVYIDGIAQTPAITINTDSREEIRIEDIPDTWAGYAFSAYLLCEDVDDEDLEIYSPIIFVYTTFGD